LKLKGNQVAKWDIYHDKMFNYCLVLSKNEDGPIMTIATTKIKEIFFDLNGNIINKKGEVVAIVHQYNRKLDILKKVLEKYCPEISR
jgi:hypothetical protein